MILIDDKNMKRYVILLVLVFALSGCSPSTPVTGATYNFEYDDQYYFDKTMDFNTIAATQGGYYFFGGPQFMYLYYIDKSTMKPVLMCNKPDCLHTEETNPTRITSCNAFFQNSNANMMHYRSSLYVLQTTSVMGFVLNKVSLDATKRKALCSFGEFLSFAIIHRGYLYYVVNDAATVGSTASPTESRVYRIAVDNTKKNPELIFRFEGYNTMIHDLKGYGEYVYFSVNSYMDSNFTEQQDTIYRYDTAKSESVKVVDNANRFTFNKDTLLFDDKRQIFASNLDGSGIRKLDNVVGYPICADDRFIYTTNYTNNRLEINIFDWNGSVIKTFQLSPLFYLCGCDEKYLFIYEMGSNEFGEISKLYIVDKDKLPNGTATMEKVYEYVPDKEFPGIVTYN